MFVCFPKLALLCLLLSLSKASLAEIFFDFSGKSSLEFTLYGDEGQFANQDYHGNGSFAVQPEFYWEWNDGSDTVSFSPFGRIDQRDDERSHGDIRELYWTHVTNNWEIHAGIRKVFWGVTEFNHLVDVINQTDGLESFDGEEKLGQPMINVSSVTQQGIIDAFILLGFRERRFVGEDGRLRSSLLVNTDEAQYESSEGDEHIDLALRWSHSFSVFDVGAYWFNGTDREPTLQAQVINGELQLKPFYQQVTQYGLDLQATVDSWLWKLEALHKDSEADAYAATQAGFEYTLYGVQQSLVDVGLLLEYAWDERDLAASSIAQNDWYLGARITLNDEDDSTLLMGFSYDQDYYTRSVLLEASKRLNDRWTIELEGLLFIAENEVDPAAALEQDDRIQLTLERFF